MSTPTRKPVLPCASACAGRGFSLVELMITLTMLAVTVVVIMTVMYAASRSKTSTANRVESAQAARIAMDMIANDLRSAGYGADRDWTAQPQPPIAYIDSLQVLLNANLNPYPDTAAAGPRSPLAYAPTGAPKPFPLNGTSWQPPIRYRSGAEVVRWTLDVNNDGAVDAGDVDAPAGIDAKRTPNPSDYILAREVYGDSTGNVTGNNGGSVERIALVSPPGGAVPPLFTVYMRGSTTPWDWSSGPVPATQLANIERVVVQLVAPSGKPDWRGTYAVTKLRTEVQSLRNVPDFGAPLYAVDGFIFDDLNLDGDKDAGEPGLSNVQVRLGSAYTAYSSSTGYFLFQAPAGTYTLRHTPPPGYGVLTNPDSFVVTVGPPQTRSFADSAVAGGNVTVLAFDDQDGDGVHDAGEPGMRNIYFSLSPGNASAYTDSAGLATLFARAGAYTATCTPPDSYVVTSANPVSGVMTDGGSASYSFGLAKTGTGTITGRVFRDNNKNGTQDAGEPGIQAVWVGVTPDAGLTVMGYDYTDSNGDYSIVTPVNDPPATTPYYVTAIVPPGYYATTTTAIGPIFIQNGDLLNDKNFGMNAFEVITLNASRVLSLGSVDLIEKDWSGADSQYDTKGHKDVDLVLGADAGGTDNISVWFNAYDGSPLYDVNPTYTRNAPQSVLSLAIDTLDANAPQVRPDLVTGTKNAGAGNFFVWYCQNSGGNLGYFPTTYSTGQAYRTSDAGDIQAVLTYDCAGGAFPDIIVGTKSPTANQGTFEVWQSNDAVTPSFTRDEVYPPAGSIPGGALGEVTAMALADFNNDGKRDLVVGTRTGDYNGKLTFFKFVSKPNGMRFVHQSTYTLSADAVTALAVADVNGDGNQDVVVGTQDGSASGHLQFWRNETPLLFDFSLKRQVNPPGFVTSLAAGDFGGLTRNDIVMGYRADASGYGGGVRLYYTDAGTLPASGVDPSGGVIVNFVPALTVNNFNYGAKPSPPPPPFLSDFAAGVKSSAATGALIVFIR